MMIHGVVVLYYPNEKVKDNIKAYIDDLDLLYVVDNTPDADNSVWFSFDPKIRYFALKENKGIAAALNIGAREGIKNGASWLLTMDQDSRFDNDGLR